VISSLPLSLLIKKRIFSHLLRIELGGGEEGEVMQLL
jgi:hypothetical protein